MRERRDAFGEPGRIGVNYQVQLQPGGRLVAEADHLPEFPGRIDVHQRKRRARGIERLHRQMQHDGGILADRIQHHRIAEFGRNLAHDVERFSLQPP